ncbi:MAG: pilus assembly protein PilB, partial [Planctomycetes bacterium]|nr:pilus assembly protein PilB [Planctomycetota bacterium]
IFEIMVIKEETRRLIAEQANTNLIRIAAKKNGMRTLRESGLIAIDDGLTTIEEIVRETM